MVYPAIALTASAQLPVAPEVDKELRSRAEEFFRFQQEKKFRQAESIVADESKDDYYSAYKPALEGFKISKIEYLESGTKAHLFILAKARVSIMGSSAPQIFEVPSMSTWKLENGKWFWYMDKELLRSTPFGQAKAQTSNTNPSDLYKEQSRTAPSLEDIQNSIRAEPSSISLVPGGASVSVVISNSLPGDARVAIAKRSTPIAGLQFSSEEVTVKSNGKTELRFSAVSGSKFNEEITLIAEPLGRQISIRVQTR